jgi:hypothetical protein
MLRRGDGPTGCRRARHDVGQALARGPARCVWKDRMVTRRPGGSRAERRTAGSAALKGVVVGQRGVPIPWWLTPPWPALSPLGIPAAAGALTPLVVMSNCEASPRVFAGLAPRRRICFSGLGSVGVRQSWWPGLAADFPDLVCTTDPWEYRLHPITYLCTTLHVVWAVRQISEFSWPSDMPEPVARGGTRSGSVHMADELRGPSHGTVSVTLLVHWR